MHEDREQEVTVSTIDRFNEELTVNDGLCIAAHQIILEGREPLIICYSSATTNMLAVTTV